MTESKRVPSCPKCGELLDEGGWCCQCGFQSAEELVALHRQWKRSTGEDLKKEVGFLSELIGQEIEVLPSVGYNQLMQGTLLGVRWVIGVWWLELGPTAAFLKAGKDGLWRCAVKPGMVVRLAEYTSD